MAVNYSSANYLANVADVVVAASTTETVVVSNIEPSQAGSVNFKAKMICSAAIETNAITWKLQHSWDLGSTYEDVSVGGALATVALGGTLILADATINTAGDHVALAAHGFSAGDEVYYHCDGAGIITGLANNTIYYIIEKTDGQFQLSATRALAIAGTAIALTQPVGGDGHFFTPTHSTLSLNIENSTDEPVLPLFSFVRIVATTGVLDSMSVQDLYVARRV